MKQYQNKAITDDAMPTEIRVGYWLIGIFLSLLLLWGAFIPLATGVIAPAIVGVEGNSKIVQHLNGGLVKEVFVQDGELVRQGASLASLDAKNLHDRLNELQSQYILLLARHSRLSAESLSETKITYSDWLLSRSSEAEVIEAINNQERIFQSELNLLSDKEIAYQHRINQTITLINSSQTRLQSTNAQINAIDSELVKYRQLLAQGLVTRNQTFSLENSYSETRERQASIQGTIESARDLIAQYQSELSEYKMSRRNLAAKALDLLQGQLASVEKELSTTKTLIEQSTIRAPISGYIVNSKINTVGGVITPGQTLMEIVPNNTKLIVKASIDPKDRASINKDQHAEIRFSAFNQRSTRPIKGKVTLISADRLINNNTNIPYYAANIALTEDPSSKLNGQKIHPGMQAEVIISTGERTTLDYLLSPLTQSFNRAMREH